MDDYTYASSQGQKCRNCGNESSYYSKNKSMNPMAPWRKVRDHLEAHDVSNQITMDSDEVMRERPGRYNCSDTITLFEDEIMNINRTPYSNTSPNTHYSTQSSTYGSECTSMNPRTNGYDSERFRMSKCKDQELSDSISKFSKVNSDDWSVSKRESCSRSPSSRSPSSRSPCSQSCSSRSPSSRSPSSRSPSSRSPSPYRNRTREEQSRYERTPSYEMSLTSQQHELSSDWTPLPRHWQKNAVNESRRSERDQLFRSGNMSGSRSICFGSQTDTLEPIRPGISKKDTGEKRREKYESRLGTFGSSHPPELNDSDCSCDSSKSKSNFFDFNGFSGDEENTCDCTSITEIAKMLSNDLVGDPNFTCDDKAHNQLDVSRRSTRTRPYKGLGKRHDNRYATFDIPCRSDTIQSERLSNENCECGHFSSLGALNSSDIDEISTPNQSNTSCKYCKSSPKIRKQPSHELVSESDGCMCIKRERSKSRTRSRKLEGKDCIKSIYSGRTINKTSDEGSIANRSRPVTPTSKMKKVPTYPYPQESKSKHSRHEDFYGQKKTHKQGKCACHDLDGVGSPGRDRDRYTRTAKGQNDLGSCKCKGCEVHHPPTPNSSYTDSVGNETICSKCMRRNYFDLYCNPTF